MQNRRAVIRRVGGPEVIDLADEELGPPGPGMVQVRVLASGVAYGDVQKRRGFIPGMRPPLTPGYDLAGEVEVCGPDVERFAAGDRVAAFVVNGGNAERVHVPARLLVPVPGGVESVEAVALVLDYVTAWQMLHRVARVGPGARVLVHGAGGGVGTALLELARLHGVVAFGTASPAKHDVVTRLGGIAIDYRREDFVEVVRARTGAGVDAVFDGIGGANLARSRAALRPGGCLVAFGVTTEARVGRRAIGATLLRLAAYRLFPSGRRVALYGIGRRRGADDPTIPEDLARVLALRAEGKLAPVIGAVLPLDEIGRAHAMKERAEVAGKIVLVPREAADAGP
jgi:NADPH:quinone reductase-like Zn-dependent oxidoreductase